MRSLLLLSLPLVLAVGCNAAPSITLVKISPDPAFAGDMLTCSFGGFTDADGDEPDSTYEWRVNGVLESTESTLGMSLVHGDSVECTVTPSDGSATGETLSESLTISNTSPVLADVTLSPPFDAFSDGTLTCIPGATTDIDGTLAFTYTFEWRVDSVDPGVTEDTLTEEHYVKGQAVTCIATPNDGLDDGAAVVSNEVTIANSAPTVNAVTITPDPATAMDTLLCEWAFVDIDGDIDASTVAWSVNGKPVGTATTLASGFVGGDGVTCAVTPNDGDDVGVVVQATTIIENSAPSISGVSVTPQPALAGDVFTCEYTGFSDADGNDDASRFEWLLNGDSVSTTSTMSEPVVGGDVVACHVTPNDGVEDGVTMSESFTIGNTPPVLTEVSLGPTPAQEGTTLTCTAESSTDVDGDTVNYSYAWRVNGGVIGATTDTLTGADFDRGDEIFCIVTPNDGTEDGASVSPPKVTIINTAPTLSGVVIDPEPATVADTLTCSWTGFSDDDDDSDESLVKWQVNGVNAGSSPILMSGFGSGDLVSCEVTAFDGLQEGTSASTSFTISNALPEVTNLTLNPAEPHTEQMAYASAATIDADGDSVTVSYVWTVDGVVVDETDAMLDGSTYFDKNQEISVTVTPNDGTEDGLSVTSDFIYAVNTAPDAPTVSVTPAAPVAGADDLVCGVDTDSYDRDEDVITYSFEWTLDGAYYSADSSVPGTETNAGEIWACTVTPNDGEEDGASSSASVTTVELVDESEAYYTSPSTDYGMNYIPPGTFEMGCTVAYWDCNENESPVHEVTLTNGFYIGVTEITRDQWESVMGSWGFASPSGGVASGYDNYPANEVSWEEVVEYANLLSDADGLTRVYTNASGDYTQDLNADGYRMPTEAEWEFAARCGEDTLYVGSDNIDDVGWSDDNSDGSTHEVAERSPNACGLYDMTGNVYEWTWDWFDAYYYDGGDMNDPVGPDMGTLRVLRGGAWNTGSENARVSKRGFHAPSDNYDGLGLRLVRTVHTD